MVRIQRVLLHPLKPDNSASENPTFSSSVSGSLGEAQTYPNGRLCILMGNAQTVRMNQ